jgi:hypothetical protein
VGTFIVTPACKSEFLNITGTLSTYRIPKAMQTPFPTTIPIRESHQAVLVVTRDVALLQCVMGLFPQGPVARAIS